MKLNQLTIEEYSTLLEEKKSIPGGGSALALVLELATDLSLMTCNFTVNKNGYEEVQIEIKSIIEKLKIIKDSAHQLIDEDGIAYQQVMNAYKSKDSLKISKASIYACEVPYKLFKLTKECEELCLRTSKIGNKNLLSDALISLDLCHSIYSGCLNNIKCNIDNILDENIKNKYLQLGE